MKMMFKFECQFIKKPKLKVINFYIKNLSISFRHRFKGYCYKLGINWALEITSPIQALHNKFQRVKFMFEIIKK